MAEVTHRIGRLQIEVLDEDPERAFAIRHQLRDGWDSLLGELQQEFDGLARADQWLRIPRLSLHITLASSEDLKQDLLSRLRRAIADQRVAERAAAVAEVGDFRSIFSTAQSPRQIGDLTSEPNTAEVGAKHPQGVPVDVGELLVFYLVNGRLPWFASLVEDWREQFEILIERNISKLARNCIESETAYPCLRLLNLIPDSKLPITIPKLTGALGIEGRAEKLIACMQRYGSSGSGGRHQRNWLLARLIKGLARPMEVLPSQLSLAATGWRVPQSYRLPERTWQAMLSQSGYKLERMQSLTDIFLPDQSGAWTNSIDIKVGAGKMTGIRNFEATQVANESGLTESSKDQAVRPVSNAGLVLLHPYIARYLKACGIDLLASKPGRAEYDFAAGLLFYLLAGEEDPVEYELDVVKLLLGLSPEYPLPLTRGLLNAENKLEAEQLLGCFISHWPALKKTSPNGLRGSFLRRSGLLRETERHWELTIERVGVDVLLDQLPFTYSIVKLPWMPKSIHIEW